MDTKLPKTLACLCIFFLSCASSQTDKKQVKADIFHRSGALALMEGNYTEALVSLLEAYKLEPKSPGIATDLGIAYLGKKDLSKGEEYLRLALRINPEWTDAKANLGILYLGAKRYREAEAILKDATKDLVYPKSHLLHFSLASLYKAVRKPALQEKHLREALAANQTFCAAWLELGRTQKDSLQYEQAAVSFRKAVSGACFKQNPEAHYELANLLIKHKETDKAKAKLLDVIQFFPSTDWARKAELTLNMIR